MRLIKGLLVILVLTILRSNACYSQDFVRWVSKDKSYVLEKNGGNSWIMKGYSINYREVESLNNRNLILFDEINKVYVELTDDAFYSGSDRNDLKKGAEGGWQTKLPSRILVNQKASKATIKYRQTAALELVDAGGLAKNDNWLWFKNSVDSAPIGKNTILNVEPEMTTTYFVKSELFPELGFRKAVVEVDQNSYPPVIYAEEENKNEFCLNEEIKFHIKDGWLGKDAMWVWLFNDQIIDSAKVDVKIRAQKLGLNKISVAAYKSNQPVTSPVVINFRVVKLPIAPDSIFVSDNSPCPYSEIVLSEVGGILGDGNQWNYTIYYGQYPTDYTGNYNWKLQRNTITTDSFIKDSISTKPIKAIISSTNACGTTSEVEKILFPYNNGYKVTESNFFVISKMDFEKKDKIDLSTPIPNYAYYKFEWIDVEHDNKLIDTGRKLTDLVLKKKTSIALTVSNKCDSHSATFTPNETWEKQAQAKEEEAKSAKLSQIRDKENRRKNKNEERQSNKDYKKSQKLRRAKEKEKEKEKEKANVSYSSSNNYTSEHESIKDIKINMPKYLRKGSKNYRDYINSRIKCPSTLVEISTGTNSNAGVGGIAIDKHIIPALSIAGGVGYSTWGYKCYIGLKAYEKTNHIGYFFSAGMSYNTGISNYKSSETTINNISEPVVLNLLPQLNVFGSVGKYYRLGYKSRFFMSVGYSYSLTNEKINQASGSQISNDTYDLYKSLAPGGVSATMGFSFGL